MSGVWSLEIDHGRTRNFTEGISAASRFDDDLNHEWTRIFTNKKMKCSVISRRG